LPRYDQGMDEVAGPLVAFAVLTIAMLAGSIWVLRWLWMLFVGIKK
jgi:hypothetical protein